MKNKIKKLFEKIISLNCINQHSSSVHLKNDLYIIENFNDSISLAELELGLSLNPRDFYNFYFNFKEERLSLLAYNENHLTNDKFDIFTKTFYNFDSIYLFENFLFNEIKRLTYIKYE